MKEMRIEERSVNTRIAVTCAACAEQFRTGNVSGFDAEIAKYFTSEQQDRIRAAVRGSSDPYTRCREAVLIELGARMSEYAPKAIVAESVQGAPAYTRDWDRY